MIAVTNISGGQLVCDLASGKTLRLDNKQTQTINENEVTEYLKTLESRGFIKMKTLDKVSETKTTPKKSGIKNKEE